MLLNDPYVKTIDNWPPGPSNISPPPRVSRPPPGFPNLPPEFKPLPSTQPLFVNIKNNAPFLHNDAPPLENIHNPPPNLRNQDFSNPPNILDFVHLNDMPRLYNMFCQEGSSVAHEKYYEFKDIPATNSEATQYSLRSDTDEEKDDETDGSDDSDMDLSDNEPKGDADATGFGMNLMSNIVYTDAHTTSTVHNPEGNPEEMFPDDADHHISSPSVTTTHNLVTNPQENSLQAKAKKLMQNAEKNMRMINLKKAVAQKFREYDQKLGNKRLKGRDWNGKYVKRSNKMGKD
nr:hypothetical protein [Tanacetum cinerariifolium]